MDDSEKDEIITIHIDTPEGKTVSKIDVPLSELVECYMNVHYPLQSHKYDNWYANRKRKIECKRNWLLK